MFIYDALIVSKINWARWIRIGHGCWWLTLWTLWEDEVNNNFDHNSKFTQSRCTTVGQQFVCFEYSRKKEKKVVL